MNVSVYFEYVVNKIICKVNNMKDKVEILEELKINFIEKENKMYFGLSENYIFLGRYFNVLR